MQITAARQTLAGSPCRRSPGEKEDGEEGTIVGSEGGDASEVRTTRPLLCGRRRKGTVEHDQPDRLGAASWAGWPALSHKHCSRELASSTSLT